MSHQDAKGQDGPDRDGPESAGRDGGFGISADSTRGPVTTVVTRRVKPGHEQFYELFLEGIIATATRFPGHLGVEVVRPDSASAGDDRVGYRGRVPDRLPLRHRRAPARLARLR